MEFYASIQQARPEDPLEQGDILYPVPFLAYKLEAAQVVRPGQEAEPTDLTATESLEPESSLVAGIQQCVGLVLTQSCDLTGRSGTEKPVVIAKVSPLAEMFPRRAMPGRDNPPALKSRIDEFRKPLQRPYIFLLPEHGEGGFSIPVSGAELLLVTSFHPSQLPLLRKLLRCRLATHARRALREKISLCYSREALPDHLYYDEEQWEIVKDLYR